MIKSYNGFKAERTTARETLPAGGYVAKIMDASVIDYDWGSVLKIEFDIAEGEHKGFLRQIIAQTSTMIRNGAVAIASAFRTKATSISTVRKSPLTTL